MDEAFETLGLAVEPGAPAPAQSKVRKAYFKMSMKYHPDKNPEGRDMFEKVNKAYEFISSKDTKGNDGGPQTENLVLILRGQSILFRRFKAELKPYKYAGYPMLMTTISRETEDENLFSNSVDLLAAACELAHLTVACSNLNAEELRRNNGIDVLAKALQRCISVIGHKTSDDEMAVKVCTHIARCFTAACFFEGCRERMTEVPTVSKDICRCLWFEGAPMLTKAAMECVGALSQETFLQNHLLQSGVLWHLMLRLFNYDFTLDESGVEADESTNKQLFFNNHAKMSCVCLAKLGGWGSQTGAGATPKNPAIQGAVSAMLTPYLADQLAAKDAKKVLKEINSNTENPYLIWDNGTRAELTDYLEKQQEEQIKSGASDPGFGSDFKFSVFEDELKLAGVFVRIYNEQPTFTLRNPREYCTALLNFLGSQAQYIFSQGVMANEGVESASPTPSDGGGEEEEEKEEPELTPEQLAEKAAKEMERRMLQARQAMESLRNVIRANKGVDKLCNGHFKLIFSLLRYEKDPKLQMLALEVISAVMGERECVADIAKARVLVYLLLTTQSLPNGRVVAIEAMHGLMSNPKILAEAFDTGGLLYLLDLYCNSTSPQVRESTASLLAKMMNEKLRGPRMKIVLTKFLPVIFMDAMRDNPEASVSMFEGTHENPELIWNEDARSKVQSVVSELKLELYASQCADPSTKWSLPGDFEVVYENVGDELVVGGVFISLLEKQPNWVFRKPKDFLVSAMEMFLKLLQVDRTAKTTKQLEMLTNALCGLFRSQIELVNQVAALGHLNRVAAAMTKKDEEKQAALLRVCNELCESSTSIRAFSGIDFCGPVRSAMMNCNRSALAPAMEMMSKCVEENNPPMVAQALSSKLIEYMLELLKGELDTIESAAAAKAHCVKALKSMTKCLTNGDRVNEILNEAPWWKSYKDQRHDLFITSNSTAGYLMGPTSTVAGYLMAAPTTAAMSDAPPDLDAVEDDRGRTNVLGDD